MPATLLMMLCSCLHVLMLAHMLVLMPLAGYLYGRIRTRTLSQAVQHWLVRLFFDAAELVDALLPQLSSAAAVPMGSQSLLPGISRSSARQPGCVALVCVALSDTSASICVSQPGSRAASLQPFLVIPSKRCVAISHDAEKFPALVVLQQSTVFVGYFSIFACLI